MNWWSFLFIVVMGVEFSTGEGIFFLLVGFGFVCFTNGGLTVWMWFWGLFVFYEVLVVERFGSW